MSDPRLSPDTDPRLSPDEAPAAQATPPGTAWDTAKDFGVGAVGGASLGLDDETVGALHAVAHAMGVPGAKPYEQARDEWRARQDLAHTRSPTATTAGELTGGLATGLATGGAGAGAGLVREGAVMAGQGAVAGFGSSRAKDVSGLAKDTAQGAATGLIAGKSLKTIGRGLSRASPGLAEAGARSRTASVGLKNPEAYGGPGQVSQALREEGVTAGLAPSQNTMKARIRERIPQVRARLNTSQQAMDKSAQEARAGSIAREQAPLEDTPPSAARAAPQAAPSPAPVQAQPSLAPAPTPAPAQAPAPVDIAEQATVPPATKPADITEQATIPPAPRQAMRPPPPSQPGMPQVIPSPEPMELRQGMQSAGEKTLDQRKAPAEYMPEAQYPIRASASTVRPGRLRPQENRPGPVTEAFNRAEQGQVAPEDRAQGLTLQRSAQNFPKIQAHPEEQTPEQAALWGHYHDFPRTGQEPAPGMTGLEKTLPSITPGQPKPIGKQYQPIPSPPPDPAAHAQLGRKASLLSELGGHKDPLTGEMVGGAIEKAQQSRAANPVHGFGGMVVGGAVGHVLTGGAGGPVGAILGRGAVAAASGHGLSALARAQEAASTGARVAGAGLSAVSRAAAVPTVEQATDHYKEALTNPERRTEYLKD